MFSEKLNYIMTLTRTTNTEIADYLNVTQSLISRFRNGNRTPSNDSNYIMKISEYFEKKIIENDLMDKINSIGFEKDKSLSNTIYNWLNSDSEIKTNLNLNLLDDYYYGDSGKRDAVLKFMEEISKNKVKTIYSYSDENMNWLTDKNFQIKWKQYLISLLQSGTKIKIIHSLSRNYDELINAVTMWFPLYLARKYRTIFYS
jgi:transcriptional regulator with XRE-family HTH domain